MKQQIVVLAAALLIAACGGGGGQGAPAPGSPSATPQPLAGASPQPVAPPAPPASAPRDPLPASVLPPGLNAVPPLSAATRWSDPTTWGGVLPVSGAQVVIPAGKAVLLDVDTPSLAGLQVDGALYFDAKDLSLTSQWVLVRGLLQAGTPEQPFTQRATITLTGTDERADVMGFGTKFIVAADGGRLELHGHRRDALAWTRLAAHAAAGATRLTLAAAPDWRVGDRVVLAPSGYDPRDAQAVTITAIAGNTIDITPALRAPRFGELQTFDGWTLDARATVGLLTRDIVIRGDAASQASQFGGHVMVHPGGFARIAGVAFEKMGQMGHQARYPLHWHLVDRNSTRGVTGRGQYAIGNSFADSFQRAIVMHGTSHLVAARNVAFNVHNHVFVPAEDGDEENNAWMHNLAVLARPPLAGQAAFPAYTTLGPGAGETLQFEYKPSLYWSRNANHRFVGNIAAGSVNGSGFTFDNILKYDAEEPNPMLAGFAVQKPPRSIEFTDNVSHSHCVVDYETDAGFATAPLRSGGLTYQQATRAHGLLLAGITQGGRNVDYSQTRLQFTRFTAYKNCTSGAWIETERERITQSIFADNRAGIQGANVAHVQDVMVVGRSANSIGGWTAKAAGFVFDDYGNVELLSVTLRTLDVGLEFHDDFKMAGRTARFRQVGVRLPVDASSVVSRGSGYMLDEDGSLTGAARPLRVSVTRLSTHSRYDPATGVYLTEP